MARDEDLEEGPVDDEAEEEFEGEEGEEGEKFDDGDIEIEADEIVDEAAGEFDEESDDEDVVALRPSPKRRTPLRHVPMIEGVPKSRLDRPDLAKDVFAKLDEKYGHNKVVKYALSVKLVLHDKIDHSKFGPGFVTEILGPQKAEVMFQDALRKLVFNR